MKQKRGERSILCGGVYNSPQILQLSGLGPPALLKQHGIDVIRNLPGVGENLQDHFGIGLEFRSRVKSTVNDIYNNSIKGGAELLRYLLFRTGPFADNGNYSNTFIHSSPDVPTPDMMVTFMAWCTGEDLKPRPFSGFTILAEHIRPDARGQRADQGRKPRDASSDPVQLPRDRGGSAGCARRPQIRPSRLADAADVGMRRARDRAGPRRRKR